MCYSPPHTEKSYHIFYNSFNYAKLGNVADQQLFIYRKQIKCRLGKKKRSTDSSMFVTYALFHGFFLHWHHLGLEKNVQGEKKHTDSIKKIRVRLFSSQFLISSFFLVFLFFKAPVSIWRKKLQVRNTITSSSLVKNQRKDWKITKLIYRAVIKIHRCWLALHSPSRIYYKVEDTFF